MHYAQKMRVIILLCWWMNGITFGQCAFTDLDFADDISLLAELLELLAPDLEIFQEEAAPLGLEVNWFKHWALSKTSFQVRHDIQRMESFVYPGAMIHLSCSSDPQICRCSATTQLAMQSLDRHLWRSRITNKTKLHLYRAFILPIMLYGSECWANNKADM